MTDTPRRGYCQKCGRWVTLLAYWFPPVKTEYIDLCEEDYSLYVDLYGPSQD